MMISLCVRIMIGDNNTVISYMISCCGPNSVSGGSVVISKEVEDSEAI